MESDVALFGKAFKEFIKPYSCHSHGQMPTLVCIDRSCKQRGLICSICLTIHGSHKNHDSIQASKFVEQCLKAFNQDFKKDELSELIRRIDDSYEGLLKQLTDFHETYSSIIKSYIAKKNELHSERQSLLFTEHSLEQVKHCRFKNLDEMNNVLNLLVTRMSSKLEIDHTSEEKLLASTQYYLDDLNYETAYIGRHLRQIQLRLKELLTVKNSSPVVLGMEPTFNAPKHFENAEVVYIGETKMDRPHGKGLCYFKTTQKIVYGEFHNGQLEGQGELYFTTGDYYLGEFRLDKKEGRGVYNWTGKESNLYEGEFKSGKRHGRGTFWWSDGSWYEGQFRDGVQSGAGVLYREGGSREYQGNWHNGMFEGKGVQYFENGQRYEGSFKDDKFHGEGVFYKDDSVIYGVWKDNELAVVNMVKSTLGEK